VFKTSINNRTSQTSLFLVILFVLLAGCAPATLTASLTSTPSPVKGSAGIGDSLYPNLGNGGYDAQHYIISLQVDPLANTVTGSTTLLAIATDSLSSFNLDFHGLTVDAVTVNESNTKYSRRGDELTITSAVPLQAGQQFTTVVQYHGSPETISSAGLSGMGWSHGNDGVINVWGEPDAASTWFPGNNHPRDKATYRFEITVPDPWMVAASGTLKETRPGEGRTTYAWEMDRPMATYLASISIDQYDVVAKQGPNGVRIRNYFPKNLSDTNRSPFMALPEMIAFLERFFGAYPFSEYGVAVAGENGLCANTHIALEAQTMSIHCPTGSMTSQTTIVHELAHMWFGDSVSLENWQDIWLKEGFATYASWLWSANGDPAALSRIAEGARSHFSDSSASVAQPGLDNLYSSESYTGGALVLYALQKEVGDEAFFKILQTYTKRHQYGNAGTDEFIAVAEEVSGKDLTSFFNAWLFSKKMPELPQ
jgi:aminopeptidase N